MNFKIYKIPVSSIVHNYREGLTLTYDLSFSGFIANVNVLVVGGTADKTVVNSSITTKLEIKVDELADYLFIKLESSAMNTTQHTINCTLDSATYSEDGEGYELKYEYAPIRALENNEEFKVDFKHTKDVKTDIVLQTSYDNTINIIFADGVGPARLINSGIEFKDIAVIPPMTPKYNKDSLYTTELIPKYNQIPKVTFNGILSGGTLKAGGYKYYFKYATRDDIETDIVEESRLVSVHFGNGSDDSHAGAPDEETEKYASFTLSNIDPAYKKVNVYYTYYTGSVDTIGTSYKILNSFNVEDGKCQIVHTGYESVELKQPDEIAKPYNYADVVKTLTTSSNRLLLGNIANTSISTEILSAAALHCSVSAEKRYSTVSYANPIDLYNGVGYWDGESYEFGIVFVTNGGNSEVFPIMGIDGTITEDYDTSYLGKNITNHFIEDTGQNDLGVFRFPCNDDTRSFAKNSVLEEWYPKFNVSYLTSNKQYLEDNGVLGYFFVRRDRKPDLITEGLVAPTTTVYMNTMTATHKLAMNGCNYIGLGANDSGKEPDTYSKSPLGTKYVYVPAMYGAMPFTNDIHDLDKPGLYSALVFAPVFRFENFTKYAMYSPDFACAEPSFVSNYPGGSSINWKFDGVLAGNSHYQAYYEAFPLLDFTKDEKNTIFYNIYTKGTEVLKQASVHGTGTGQYVATGQLGVKPAGFTGATDRQLWNELSVFIGDNSGDDIGGFPANKPSKERQDRSVNGMFKANAPTTAYEEGAHGFIVGLRDSRDPPKIWGSSANYNSYLGVDINNDTLNSLLKLHCLPLAENEFGNQKNYYCSLFKYPYSYPPSGQARAGAYVRLYGTSSSSGYITPVAWRSRYLGSSGEAYKAITKRDSLGQTNFITGVSGDCFVGEFTQQLFFGRGIVGTPTANDPAPYFGYVNGNTREAINMAPIGLTSTVPMRSNYNFELRQLEEADATETKLYNTKRGYLPLNNARQQFGNRQFETRAYNHGHSAQNESVLTYYKFDSDKPYTQFNYSNRISVSSAGVQGTFTNGFRDFSGLNFKDYNKELGEISAIREVQGKVYVVYENGVAAINVDERSMLSTNNGSVYTDVANILSPTSQVVSSVLGSTYTSSIVKSDKALYGVDAQQHKVWRISSNGMENLSDFKVQKLIAEYSSDGLLDIYSSYNILKNEIQFTFIREDGNKSIIFNELVNVWVSTTDIHKLYSANLNGVNWFIGESTVAGSNPSHRLVRSVDDLKCGYRRLDGQVDTLDFYFKFIVNHDPSTTKIIENFTLNGSTNYPSTATYEAEFIDEYTQTLKYTSNAYKPTYFKVSDVNKNLITYEGNNMPSLDWLDLYSFNIGDLLTIINPDKTVIKASIAYIDENSKTTLHLSSDVSNVSIGAVIMKGWKLPFGLCDTEAEENKTRVQVWSRARVLSANGDRRNSNQYRLLDADTRLRGTWASIKVSSEDFSPVYVNSIDTTIIKSFS